MNVKIGPAKRADAVRLAAMARTLIEYGLPQTWTADKVAARIVHADTAVITARDGRRLAGFAIMQFYDTRAHLALLAVGRAYRKQGVGRALVDWLEACARTAGIFTVALELRETNTSALAFYERLGFRASGIRAGYYAGIEDAIRMEHDLRAASAPI